MKSQEKEGGELTFSFKILFDVAGLVESKDFLHGAG
jgi:hypothetical protein